MKQKTKILLLHINEMQPDATSFYLTILIVSHLDSFGLIFKEFRIKSDLFESHSTTKGNLKKARQVIVKV